MVQLIDLAGIYYRAFHAMPSSMTGPDGRPNGAIRGSLDMLARLIDEARPDRFIACVDVDWRPDWRVELVASYKAHRVAEAGADIESGTGLEGTDATGGDALSGHVPAERLAAPVIASLPDELAEQTAIIFDVLSAAGLTLAGAPHCEADDVIATLCAGETTRPVEVVTGDRDLLQLVREEPTPVTVRYIGAGMNKATVFDTAGLRASYGVDGPGYATMATLRGDPSDGLPGVAGIGERTAARLVQDFGSLTAIRAAAADPASSLSTTVRRRLADADDYLRRAAEVVRPRTDTALAWAAPGDLGTLPADPVDPDRLTAVSERHGLRRSVEHLLTALRTAAD